MISLEQFIERLIIGLRDASPRETVELGVLHGFAVDAAQSDTPKLAAFLSSLDGLEAFCAELHRLPALIQPVGISGSEWRFVRPVMSK
ncbi:hypothetical protein [Neorhizobium alkalisoli]|jgi:hypothetical protein|uniref:Uncharacterized protein n=1 Tax=Neorhizobium alkalisoli TaxID=528178 RepID=A0A561PVT1_9HYPH|nr:hypothetical protein [Neorhizobium alkalisoli]TWF42236.1 hypothetical protein FHW37_12314 [Neorhizobium alkalisoli]